MLQRAFAALLSGCGGLLAELVLVRRGGLLLGNTAEAAVLVLGLFLAALGAGGVLGPRQSRRRGAGAAARLYLLVAVALVAADAMLRWMPARASSLALLQLGIGVGLPAFAMGAAFPQLFVAHRSGFLVAANLLGSVVAAGVGGNFAIPEFGLGTTMLLASACYGLAAAVLAVGAGTPPPARVAGPDSGGITAHGRRVAFASGAAVLGLEVLCLRRLPFWLEGFQPTFSGILAAALAWLTLGAALAPLGRRRPALALDVAVAAAALLVLAGPLERLAPALAAELLPRVTDTPGMHLRIVLAALVATVPLLPLGAVVPLLLTAESGGSEERKAGLLFFWQGIGSLAGALLVGHLLPWFTPGSWFGLAPGVVAGLALLGLATPRLRTAGALVALLIAAAGSAGAGPLWAPHAPIRGSRYDRPYYEPLAHRTDAVTTASLVYDASTHGLTLFTDEFRAAYLGPGTAYMKALAHLPMLLANRVRRAAVIALGTGTTANALCAWGGLERIDVVELSPAVLALADRFAADGPRPIAEAAPFRRDPRVQIHVTDGRRFLAAAPAGEYDLVTMEPLLPYMPGTVPLYTREFYRVAARALAASGLLVQWVPTHAMPESFYKTLVRTFAEGFPYASAFLFDQSTLLVGSREPHLPACSEVQARLVALPPELRLSVHESGIAGTQDLLLAHVGDWLTPVGEGGEVLSDERPFLERLGHWSGRRKQAFLGENLAVLARALRSGSGEWQAPTWTEVRRARLHGSRELVRELAPASVLAWREARAPAPMPPPAAWGRLRELGRLPAAAELSGILQRPGSEARALLAVFPDRCAQALVGSLLAAPLGTSGRSALREVLDPDWLSLACRQVQARHGSLAQEILPLWGPELPLPPELGELARGSVEERKAFADALAGRADAAARQALGGLLLDAEPGVRVAAAAALFRTVGDRIPYDPDWPLAARQRAAEALTAR